MMEKLLLHACCAPCSVSCIEPLKGEGFDITAYWYNPNIHPYTEYKARRDCMIDYAAAQNIGILVQDEYGLVPFVEHVAEDIAGRCRYCYEHRLEMTARFAAEQGYDGFTTTLLASIYQKHDDIAAYGERIGAEYGVTFLYRDFRPNFRAGNQKARDEGLYMQKYCGCVFSEGERYGKQIMRDREKFDTLLKGEK